MESRDSVRISLTIAVLNNLDVLGADVQNAFLTAPNKKMCWMIARPEFGPEEGKTVLVVKALYGLKSASFTFCSYTAEQLTEIGFESTIADPDVWLRAATNGDGERYYEKNPKSKLTCCRCTQLYNHSTCTNSYSPCVGCKYLP